MFQAGKAGDDLEKRELSKTGAKQKRRDGLDCQALPVQDWGAEAGLHGPVQGKGGI